MAVDIRHIEKEFDNLLKEVKALKEKYPYQAPLFFLSTQLTLLKPWIKEIAENKFQYVTSMEHKLIALEGLTKNFEKNTTEKALFKDILVRLDTLRKQLDMLRKELKL